MKNKLLKTNEFYLKYAENTNSGMALHQAKKKYLKKADEITADPYYWGAWIHIGPKPESTVNVRVIMVIIIILLGGVVFARVLIKGS